MKKKTIIFAGILVFTTILSGCFAPKNSADLSGLYCAPEGKLTETMPIQSHRSYCIKSSAKIYSANIPAEYSFSVITDQGNTIKDFEITHTKPMHVIVVRKDLKYFQHLHPEFNEQTGVFTIPEMQFPADGVYRIFADFVPRGGQMGAGGMSLPITISEDVSVGIGEKYKPESIGSEDKVPAGGKTKTFDGYQVTLSTDQDLAVAGKEVMLTFDIQQNGEPIKDLQEYLGALGHSVILREGSLDFIHAHPVQSPDQPQSGKVQFMVHFPLAGKYKIFTQFQRNNEVFTTDFVLSVEPGVKSANSMPGMSHAM